MPTLSMYNSDYFIFLNCIITLTRTCLGSVSTFNTLDISFLKHLFDLVGSDDMATEVFSIQRARASPIRSTTTARIIDHINESCTVFVTWDDVMDTDIDVRLLYYYEIQNFIKW